MTSERLAPHAWSSANDSSTHLKIHILKIGDKAHQQVVVVHLHGQLTGTNRFSFTVCSQDATFHQRRRTGQDTRSLTPIGSTKQNDLHLLQSFVELLLILHPPSQKERALGQCCNETNLSVAIQLVNELAGALDEIYRLLWLQTLPLQR